MPDTTSVYRTNDADQRRAESVAFSESASVSTSSGLPAGVTLQAIDGGSTYYTDNGFTYAAARGWDDGFVPIGTWYSRISDQPNIDMLLDLHMNTCFRCEGSANLPLARSNGLSVVLDWQREGGEIPLVDVGAETTALMAYDEPGDYTTGWTTPISSAANSLQDGRPWYVNMTWNWPTFQDTSGVPAATAMSNLIATPNSTTRHMDWQSADEYWCAGEAATSKYHGGMMFLGGARDFTADECRRANWYGDMIDIERGFQAGHYPAPIGSFIENGGPMIEDTTAASYITPDELKWAVIMSLIHGARNIMYFNHSFAGPATSNNNLAQTYYQTIQSGQTISIYDQTKAINALVTSLAAEITSPQAVGYLTVSPSKTQFGGIDARSMYRASTNQFTIMATTRYSQSVTNTSATFTTAGNYSGPVTVVGESRTVTATSGVFSDTFAKASDAHIYQLPNA